MTSASTLAASRPIVVFWSCCVVGLVGVSSSRDVHFTYGTMSKNTKTQQQQTTYAPSSPSRRASSSLVAWCNRGEAAASGEAALSASGDGAAAAAWTQVRRVLRTLYQ